MGESKVWFGCVYKVEGGEEDGFESGMWPEIVTSMELT